MTTTITETISERDLAIMVYGAGDDGDGIPIDHVHCCDPTIALCGEYIGDLEEDDETWGDEEGKVCDACASMEEARVPCCITCHYAS